MVAPCPESNPKAQYPLGIGWRPCDMTSIEPIPPLEQPIRETDRQQPLSFSVQLCAFEEEISPRAVYYDTSFDAADNNVDQWQTAKPSVGGAPGRLEAIDTPSAGNMMFPPFDGQLEPGIVTFKPDLGEGEVLVSPPRMQDLPESESPDIQLREAESYYAMAVDADKQLDESAMNMYLDAAIAAYRYMDRMPPQAQTSKGTARAWEVYHSSLARLMFIADRTGHIDKATGIRLPVNGGYRIVQFEYANFQRTAEDFDRWHIVGNYQSRYLLTKHRQQGLGVPMVCVRHRKENDKWYPPEIPFAVTGILRPESEMGLYDATTEATVPDGMHVEQVVARLELYDPRTSGDVEFKCHQVPLAKDLTAPYAYMLSETRGESKLASLHPSRNISDRGLFILEPHQKGKIPVVFVHGALSAPYTWAGIANEIDSNPDLAARYEVWGFSYPTGAPFLETAAILREQLDEIILEMDPSGFDRDLRNVVLIGHSMGGILSKLQAADSGNVLWQYTAFQPLETLKTTQKMHDYLQRQFYFTHSPNVGRVIFIGTPHQGTSLESSTIGHFSASLVHQDPSLIEAHRRLLEDNPAAFRKEFRRRVPVSMDLINPDSLLLKGIYELPIAPEIPSHTILGGGWWTIHDGRSDGVVPVSSARLPGVQTEIMVNAQHTHLNRDAGTVCEILRILRVHGTRPAFTGS